MNILRMIKIPFLKNLTLNHVQRVEILVIITIILFVLYIFYSLNLFKKQ